MAKNVDRLRTPQIGTRDKGCHLSTQREMARATPNTVATNVKRILEYGLPTLNQNVPSTCPSTPPSDTQPMTRGRIGTLRTMMTSPAMVMPTAWIMRPNVAAVCGSMWSALVKTGKATAAPPSAVAPATKEPSVIVSDTGQCSAKKFQESVVTM